MADAQVRLRDGQVVERRDRATAGTPTPEAPVAPALA
jgi:hypothetical protein